MPIYETDKHRRDQMLAITHLLAVEPRFGSCRVTFFPTLSVIDAYIEGDKHWAVEIKRRSTSMFHYPDYTIDLRKLNDGVHARNMLGFDNYILVVWWADVMGMLWVDEEKLGGWAHNLQDGSRRRGDPKDIDEVYRIPLSAFRKYRPPGGKNADQA